jgi:Spy/CpxP family protein refolding chaperone
VNSNPGKLRVSAFRTHALLTGIVLVILVAAGSGRAQPASGPGGPPPNRKLEALRIWRLTQELDLSEDQAAQFFPKLKGLRELRQQHRAARSALLDELEARLKDEPVDPSAIKPVLDSLVAVDENAREAELRLRREIAELLTIEQQARLYIFEATFDRQARRVIQQIQQDKGRRK